MRGIRLGLIGLLLVGLLGCGPETPAVQPPPPSPHGATVPSATRAPTPTPTPPPAASPTPRRGVEGPLTAAGHPAQGLALAAGSPVRYALLVGGLARSDDGGATWKQVSAQALPRVLVSPHAPLTLYAGDMAPCYKDGPDPAFQRSDDGGQTWFELPGGRGIRPVAEHPQRRGTLYGISCHGFHISGDGGQSWQLTGPTMGWEVTSLLPVAGDTVRFLAVLTSEGGTSRLAWFGENGKALPDPAPGLTFWGRGVLAQSGHALFLADSTAVRRSDDGGNHWLAFKDGLADVVLATDPLTSGVSQEDSQRGFGLLALAADPALPQRLALGSVRGLYLSRDRGEHWQPLAADVLGQLKVTDVAWDPAAPGTLYATTPQGVLTVRVE